MTRILQPGRIAVLLLCLLLGFFFVLEAAHGHAEPGGHCGLCLLTHAAALVPALPALAAALRVLLALAAAQALPCARFQARLYRIRPPPSAA